MSKLGHFEIGSWDHLLCGYGHAEAIWIIVEDRTKIYRGG